MKEERRAEPLPPLRHALAAIDQCTPKPTVAKATRLLGTALVNANKPPTTGVSSISSNSTQRVRVRVPQSNPRPFTSSR